MTADRGDDARRAGPRRRTSAGVLADRMAATLVHHEPGWRLPRLTAMARRYSVSTAEVDAAIDELAARHLLRRLPDGQVYRASPAEYCIPIEGLTGLTSHVDPMGGQLVCRSRHVSRRRPPEDIGRSLGLAPGEPVLAIRSMWTVGGEPGALSASYLPERLGNVLPDFGPPFTLPGDVSPAAGAPAHGDPADGSPADGAPPDAAPADSAAADGAAAPPETSASQGRPPADIPGRARALQIEFAPPPPSVARSLRLAVGELVATVTISFEDPAAQRPIAITIAMLRPDLFRIVVQATSAGHTDGLASAWTHAAQGWDS